MLDFDADKLLYTIPEESHNVDALRTLLDQHPEVQYVSFVGIDIGGHDTDEKIPMKLFKENMRDMLVNGVQTDGSSVALPEIASLGNAKVDIIPDASVNWYVDYNMGNLCPKLGGLPVGTLRIPSILVHNGNYECDSRSILKRASARLKKVVMDELTEHPYVFEHLNGVDSVDEIEDLVLTSATELEFWVKTPDDRGDREQLFTSQTLKEQYWKRTYGDVRTALEDTLVILDKYGFNVEMGHKEVGGVKAKMGHSGHYDHVMEQLEIDWKYAEALQAADNENMIKYVVRDTFTRRGLDVTFMAKPFEGVAGNGEHTHIGMAAKLKNGKTVNLFAPDDMKGEFLSSIGFGALMGILKNYEVMNPFISASNDSLNRLKPGFEAPICIVTSLGKSVEVPSRNRTVLIGVVRDSEKPLATRFEFRAPNPKSNTYLVLSSAYLAIADGIRAAVEAEKQPADLEKSLSKAYGEEDFYLEKDRQYRSEEDVFEYYSPEEREKLFGKAPATVWENISALDQSEKTAIFDPEVMDEKLLKSYKVQMLGQWKTELHDRIIPDAMNFVRACEKKHTSLDSDYDAVKWIEIDKIRHELAKDTLTEKSLLTRAKEALDAEDYEKASALQVEIKAKIDELHNLYEEYKRNLF